MTSRSPVNLGIVALALALSTARLSAADASESSQRNQGVIREYAYKYYLAYLEKYGFLLRIQQMLKACDLEQLAAQVDNDLPKVAIFAAEQFAADRKSAPPELSTREMSMAVVLATQSLTEGYEHRYLEAFKSAAKTSSACTGVGTVYDAYLKSKQK